MSLAFSQGTLQSEERKSVLQAVQEQAKAAACAAIKPILEAFLSQAQQRGDQVSQ